MDRRQRLIKIFEDTQAFYKNDNNLAARVDASQAATKLYGPDEYPELISAMEKAGEIAVTKAKTFEAAIRLHEEYPDKKVAVLNFASATNPGGGVKREVARRKKACADVQPYFQH